MKWWINNFPEEFDNHEIVFRTIKKFKEDNIIYYDNPICSVSIDEENKEMTLFDSTSAIYQ